MRHQRWLASFGVRKLGAEASGRFGSSSGPYAHAPSSVMLRRRSASIPVAARRWKKGVGELSSLLTVFGENANRR
jgi:hypothetical protein